MAINTGSYFKNSSQLWQYNEAWRARRKESNDEFLSRTSSAASAFGSAQLNLVNGMAAVTQQVAAKRIQQAQQAAIQKALSGFNLTA